MRERATAMDGPVLEQTAEEPREGAEQVGRWRARPGGRAVPQRFGIAFQPIVDVVRGVNFAHEALVRGRAGELAGTILGRVGFQDLHAFDHRCRIAALETAARIGLVGAISINFMPNAVYEPENWLRTSLRTARRLGIAPDRLIFEVTETERVRDVRALAHIVAIHRRFGFRTAIDDFGAGFAGLALLADMRPDVLKIDTALIRGIEVDPVRRSIVGGIRDMAQRLGIELVAEGIETTAERDALLDLGITLQQGFLFARPVFEDWVPPTRLRGLPPAAGRG